MAILNTVRDRDQKKYVNALIIRSNDVFIGEEDALVKALKRGNLIEDDTINSPKKLNIGVDTVR